MFVFIIIIFIVLFSAVLIMSWSLGLLLAHGKCEKLFSRWGGEGGMFTDECVCCSITNWIFIFSLHPSLLWSAGVSRVTLLTGFQGNPY